VGGFSAGRAAGLVAAQMMGVRGWLWFALAFSLIVAAGSAKAETIPATLNPTSSPLLQWCVNETPSPVGVCAGLDADGSTACIEAFGSEYGFALEQNKCWRSAYSSKGSAIQATTCNGVVVAAGVMCGGDYSCPSGQNWTPSGSSCTRPDCANGEVRDSSGVCQSPCGTDGASLVNGSCQCPGASQDFNTTDKTCNCNAARLEGRGTSIGGTGTAPTSDTSCYGGCVVNHGGLTVTAGTGATANWASSIASFTSTKCTEASPNAATPTEDTRTPEQKCLASGGGYITTSSGTVCTDANDSPTPVTKTTEQETVTKDSTGAVTGSESTETVCVGDECTTTTTTRDANGNVTGTTVTSGAGGVDGSGDGDEPSECEKFPSRIGCAEFGEPTEGEALGTNEVGLSSLSPALSSAGSCPADVNLPRGMKFSFEYVCMYASGIRPVVLALAWLSAGFLLFGMRFD